MKLPPVDFLPTLGLPCTYCVHSLLLLSIIIKKTYWLEIKRKQKFHKKELWFATLFENSARNYNMQVSSFSLSLTFSLHLFHSLILYLLPIFFSFNEDTNFSMLNGKRESSKNRPYIASFSNPRILSLFIFPLPFCLS